MAAESGGRILIGMIRATGRPGQTATAMAMAAACQGADLIHFRPGDVDIAARRIQARRFDGRRWQPCESRYPDVLENDDACQRRKHRAVWKSLTGTAPHTTHRLGGKRAFLDRVRPGTLLDALKIPQAVPEVDPELAAFVEAHGCAILKPAFGAQGRGMWKLDAADGAIRARHSEGSVRDFARDAGGILEALTGGRTFLAQRFVASVLPGGSPFDIRLHVRRDHRGRWQTVKIYARIGLPTSFTSNLAAGGGTGEIAPVLALVVPGKADEIGEELRGLARALPHEVQALYPDFEIDALGIDLGLDATGGLWLFEVNSFPGAKYFPVDAAIPRIGYAIRLAEAARQDAR